MKRQRVFWVMFVRGERSVLGVLLLCVFLSSCISIKNVGKGERVIVENKIKVDYRGILQTEDIKKQSDAKSAYVFIEDGMVPKISTSLFFWKRYSHAPKLDTLQIVASMENIRNYYNSQGFFNNRVEYSIKARKKKRYDAISVYFNVILNRPFYVHEVSYDVDSAMTKKLPKDFVLKGRIFKYADIEKKIKDVQMVYKENGFFNIKGSDFNAELDTFGNMNRGDTVKLVNVRFHYSENVDSSLLKQYVIKEVSFVSNYNPKDSLLEKRLNVDSNWEGFEQIKVFKPLNIIKPSVLWALNNLDTNALYNESVYKRNLSNLYGVNVWNNILIQSRFFEDTIIEGKRFGCLGLRYFLQKNSKYNMGSELGMSYNSFPWADANAFVNFLPQNTWGLNWLAFLSVKNTYNKGVESKVSIRSALESFLNLNDFTLTTYDFAVDFSQKIPWLLLFKVYKKKGYVLSSLVNSGLGLTQRVGYYNLKNWNGGLAWRFENLKKNWVVELRGIGFSFVVLDKSSLFLEDIKNNPYLKYAFNDGLTAGINFNFAKNFYHQRGHSTFLNLNVEESGMTWGFPISSIDKNYQLFKYIKVAPSIVHNINFENHSLHFRFRGGYGISFGSDSNLNKNLPFFKQFFVGGPNSMRGWNIARLGLGTSAEHDTTSFKDRYGDIVLEANVEYRFKIIQFGSVRIEGAIFGDVGNVWNRDNYLKTNPATVFVLSDLYHSIGMAGGVGVRVGFGVLVLRLDGAMKVKDPIYEFSKQYFNSNNMNVSNIAIQFGVGYPF